MSYDYQQHRPSVFTEVGVAKLLRVRDFARRALNLSGAIQAEELIRAASGGDSWESMALIDYLVETRELVLVYDKGAWQHRVYVRGILV